MTILYIIGGLLCLTLAIYFLDRREKMVREIKLIKEYKKDIEDTNQQLDELTQQLESLNQPLSQLNKFSKKILSYMK